MENGSYICSVCKTMTVDMEFDTGKNGLGEEKEWRVYCCSKCGRECSVEHYYGDKYEYGEEIELND